MTKELIQRSRQGSDLPNTPLFVLTSLLGLCVMIAFAAVAMGIARATALPFAEAGGRFAVAGLVGVAIVAMGGLTAAVVHDRTVPVRSE